MNIVNEIKNLCVAHDEDASKTIAKIKALIDKSEYPDFENMSSGEYFTYNDIEFIYLGQEQGGALCITANPIGKYPFDKDSNNNWKECSLRDILIDKFLPKLNCSDLLPFEMDLTADNGDTAYGTASEIVGILSCDLYRKYRNVVPTFSEWMWTCTPWHCNPTYALYVRFVNTDGSLNRYTASISSGCVPACIFTIRKS